RHRFLLRTLALGSSAISAANLGDFATEAGRTTLAWLVATIVGLLGTGLLSRPGFLDPATTIGVILFGILVVAATALPLYVWTRRAVMRALECAPVEVACELIDAMPGDPKLGRRIQRRLVAALVTPVAFVTIGSTLIVTAHVRKSDGERQDATALAMARAAFETVPGPLPHAGLDEATEAAERLGYVARYSPEFLQYRRNRTLDGNTELFAPLDEGSVRVGVKATNFRGIGPIAWMIAAGAASLAAFVGLRLGSILMRDIQAAILGVRALDTTLVLQGGAKVVGPTRFQVVSDLGMAIEELAGRFRVFAQAQERAILLREAATRMRGLFFASVSHDLKTPLNAILGFAAVIRQTEELTEEQEESLGVIERSGRELLALIEMILDAARVEARQLKLLCEPVTVGDLMHDIIEKGRYLAGDNPIEVVGDIADGIGPLEVDRVRLASALGTFLGYAGRTVSGALIRLHIAPLGTDRVGFAIENPRAPPRPGECQSGSSEPPSTARDPTRHGASGLGPWHGPRPVGHRAARWSTQNPGSRSERSAFRRHTSRAQAHLRSARGAERNAKRCTDSTFPPPKCGGITRHFPQFVASVSTCAPCPACSFVHASGVRQSIRDSGVV
ncbi:MAG: HAMP domain-containing sensor histidine kinase, partial [Polyangiaceae bacterium]